MQAVGPGPIEAFFAAMALIFGLGGSVPLGVPPMDEDQVIAQVVPEDCFFYASWRGMARPDAASDNQTEQLLAEPEVQAFLSQVTSAIGTAIERNAREPEVKAIVAELPLLAKSIFTRPCAVYVTKFHGEPKPEIAGALIANVGEDAVKVRESLDQLTAMVAAHDVRHSDVKIAGKTFQSLQLPEGKVALHWRMNGDYLLMAIGTESAEQLVALVNGEAKRPAWLDELSARTKIERPGMTTYFNVARLFEQLGPAAASPQVQMALEISGLRGVRYVGSVTGLDRTALATRSFVKLDGEPVGLLTALAGKPLTANDLRSVPRDATFAVVKRIDLAELYKQLVDSASRVNPAVAAIAAHAVDQGGETVGFRIEEDLLAALGDVWCLSNAPSAGGSILGGVSLTVNIRDRDRLTMTNGKLIALARKELARQRQAPPLAINEFTFRDERVFYVQFSESLPIAPAWCMTDDTLVVALFPQTIKSFLARQSHKSLADVPVVKELLDSQNAPSTLVYHDTAAMMDMFYPLVQLGMPAVSAALRKSGLTVESPMLPSMEALRPHLTPGYMCIRRVEGGLLIDGRQSIPVVQTALGAMMPATVAILVPAIQSAREAAREAPQAHLEGGPKRVRVSGRVTIDGKPLTQGTVQFVAEGRRPAMGTLDEKGHFILSTFEQGDGAMPGKYRVAINAGKVQKDGRLLWLAPKKYADFHTSPIEVEINDQSEVIELNLTWDGGVPFVEIPK